MVGKAWETKKGSHEVSSYVELTLHLGTADDISPGSQTIHYVTIIAGLVVLEAMQDSYHRRCDTELQQAGTMLPEVAQYQGSSAGQKMQLHVSGSRV